MIHRLAWFLSFSVGFISLSEEIVWVRVISFTIKGVPTAFPLVLIMFLAGIAFGAMRGKELSASGKATPETAGKIFLIAGIILFLMPILLGFLTSYPRLFLGCSLCLIFISSAIKGILFPIVHHFGSETGTKLGRSASRVYFANIIGSTLGPLVTGLVVLNVLSSGSALQFLGVLSILVSTVLLLLRPEKQKNQVLTLPILMSVITIGLLTYSLMFLGGNTLIHQIALGERNISDLKILHENRYGIVHVATDDEIKGNEHIDIVYGGNVYDGRINLDLANNSNMIDRAYLAYALHPSPKKVLMIGMSSGAWLRILTAVPNVETIDVVEINPGYLQIIESYDLLAPLLDDKRIQLHIDDGRRWLRRHHEKFDLIIMNTTFHWRANATNLLSKEMMSLVKDSLAPGGLVAFNATGSVDVFYTAANAFPHAYQHRNFVYAANHDLREQQANVRARLHQFQLPGQAYFHEEPTYQKASEELGAITMKTIDDVLKNLKRTPEIVTDQNMITEYKYGYSR